jgi:hypothetical protein
MRLNESTPAPGNPTVLPYARAQIRNPLTWKRSAAVALVLIAAIGIRRDTRFPLQRFGDFSAMWQIQRWSFFGNEVLSSNKLFVLRSTDEYRRGPFTNLQSGIRICGHCFGNAPLAFVTHDGSYDPKPVFAYIIRAKLASPNREDRIWAVNTLWGECYPGQLQDVEQLLNDPDPEVTHAVRLRLEESGRLQPATNPTGAT